MSKKLTQDELEYRVAKYMGDEYKVVGTYVGAKTPVDVLHLKCNTVSQIYISQLEHHKSWCVKCKAKEKYTHIFIDRLNDLYNNEYELVSEYVNNSTSVNLRHKVCGNIDTLLPATITSGDWAGCTRCRDTINSLEKLINKMREINYNVKIIGDFYGVTKRIDCECIICGHKWSPYVQNLLEGCGCPECAKNNMGKAIRGINDLWTTHPHIAMMLKNPEDGYLYSYGSGKSSVFVCPNCGYEYDACFNDLTIDMKRCPRCSDGISYPEKFMRDILEQLNINYISQYSPEWAGKMMYDFYFKLNDIDYIVEMDGSFHYEDNKMNNFDVVYNDKIKDRLAIEHNIKLIRINCNYIDIRNRFEYIKNSIVNSDIANILDLSVINFSHCDIESQSSLVTKAGQLWDSGIYDLSKISEILHVSENTVRGYLKTSEKYQMSTFCDKDYSNFVKEIGYKIVSIKASKPIRCLTTGEIYYKQADAVDLYGVGVSMCINGRRKSAGKLEDGTRLKWEALSDLEASKIKHQLIEDVYKQYKMININ